MKRIVIVGGGYVGSDLARRLDRHADVTLVEPREAFVHSSAMIRGLVESSLVEQALLPYDRLLDRGVVLSARANAVSGDRVTLADGSQVTADFVVVATGSSYAAPFKPAGDSIGAFRETMRAAQENLRAAKRIVIIGAGPVGTELAGEIKAAMPAKEVTLVCDTAEMFPDYPNRLGADLLRKLRLLGVEVILGQRVTDLQDATAPYAGEVSLEDGRRIAADLVFPAIGARPRTDLLASLPGACAVPDGRIRTDGWLRPSSLPSLFAAGDAVDAGDPMTIVGTARQVPWLAKTLRALLSGRPLERLAAYTPWPKAPILVPLGAHLGNSYLPPAGIAGNIATRMIKGKTLFVPKYRRQMGLD